MPSAFTGRDYGQAILDHVSGGSYPEAEDLVSADVPSSALDEVMQVIESARTDLQNSIRGISKECAPDVDGWIKQARQVQEDIRFTKIEASKIGEDARAGAALDFARTDASKQVDLLHEELRFNESVSTSLQLLQDLRHRLDVIQQEILDDTPLEAVQSLNDFEQCLPLASKLGGARIAGTLEHVYTGRREEVAARLESRWRGLVQVDERNGTIRVVKHAAGAKISSLDDIVKALQSLSLLDQTLKSFSVEFERAIVFPRLRISSNGTTTSLQAIDSGIAASESSSDLSAETLFHDLDRMVHFIRTSFPTIIVRPLAELLMPRIISKVISTWLMSALPEDLQDLDSFKSTIDLVSRFAATLRKLEWPGARDLEDWMEEISPSWLQKRTNLALDAVRKLISKGSQNVEMVERTETQVVNPQKDVLTSNTAAAEWDDNWSDEGDDETKNETTMSKSKADTGAEESDAWGWDEDKDAEAHEEVHDTRERNEEEGDAWGWNDEEDGQNVKSSPTANKKEVIASTKAISNGATSNNHVAEKTITLTETFHVTSLPKDMLVLVRQAGSDLQYLMSPDGRKSLVASSAGGLLLLPDLMLAMYRASAPTTYQLMPNGGMFLYNDCLWLAEQLQSMSESSPWNLAPGSPLEGHMISLRSFGKRSYVKEMDSQRTVINDLLEGAQGFTQCSKQPYTQECDIAVASTVDRIRLLAREWKNVLSSTALSQSLGSLLATAISKIIVDVQDLADIEESESQQLTKYCNQVSTLQDLFRPAGVANDEQEAMASTPFYVHNWFKFQYLINILEGSMADIKYMWNESELSLEFQADEVVDLIRALFADSPHRRTAIAEIRAGK